MAIGVPLQEFDVKFLPSSAHGTRLVRAMALACLPVWLLSAATHAAPPPAPEPEAAPVSATAVTPVGIGISRANIDAAMTELGQLTSQADGESDVVRAACLIDKQERGGEVMELVTNEVLVIQDAGSNDQQRTFAAEKLGALSDRMNGLVDQARACAGDASPEDKDNKTRTEVDERPTVPFADPTASGGRAPVPPPVDDGRPPTVESPTN
jgi:hypothetical protein